MVIPLDAVGVFIGPLELQLCESLLVLLVLDLFHFLEGTFVSQTHHPFHEHGGAGFFYIVGSRNETKIKTVQMVRGGRSEKRSKIFTDVMPRERINNQKPN
jgi:hypothetical protein